MADIFSEEGVFVVLPEYVLDAQISANALRLYAVLRRYADNHSREAHPSRKTLAERMNLKDPRVVDRAAIELVDAELLIMFPRYRDEDGNVARHQSGQFREQTSNGYKLIRPPMPRKVEGSASNGTGGSASNGTTGVPETVHKLEPSSLDPNELEGGRVGIGARDSFSPPPSRCSKHIDTPAAGNCGFCKDARTIHDEWNADRVARRTRSGEKRRAVIASCPDCDEAGWVVGSEPVVRCDHQRAAS